ncbi:MAG: hypothetical protein ACLTZY_01365 [Alistipes indistinctus]
MKKQFFLNLSLALLLCTGTTFAQRVDTVAVLSPSMHKTVKASWYCPPATTNRRKSGIRSFICCTGTAATTPPT